MRQSRVGTERNLKMQNNLEYQAGRVLMMKFWSPGLGQAPSKPLTGCTQKRRAIKGKSSDESPRKRTRNHATLSLTAYLPNLAERALPAFPLSGQKFVCVCICTFKECRSTSQRLQGVEACLAFCEAPPCSHLPVTLLPLQLRVLLHHCVCVCESALRQRAHTA